MRILHVIAQKPGETGSGTFLLNLLRSAAAKGHKQYLIAGISSDDKDYRDILPEDVIFDPVCFDTPGLPFPVPGMSDAMPYRSTRYSEMSSEMLCSWEAAFQETLQRAAAFEPDLIITHHLWLLSAMVKEHFDTRLVLTVSHGTELRQLCNVVPFRERVLEGCKKLDYVLALSDVQKKGDHRSLWYQRSTYPGNRRRL